MEWNKLVPELVVKNYPLSRHFYQTIFGSPCASSAWKSALATSTWMARK